MRNITDIAWGVIIVAVSMPLGALGVILGYHTLREHTPVMLKSRFSSEGGSVEPEVGAAILLGVSAVCLVCAFGYAKYVFTGRTSPFPNIFRLSERRPPRPSGEPVCAHCGYSRVGLSRSARCPECGKQTKW